MGDEHITYYITYHILDIYVSEYKMSSSLKHMMYAEKQRDLADCQRKITEREIICIWWFCNNHEPCVTIITVSDILHQIKKSNEDMEMNGCKLCKLIRRNVQAWLMVYLLDSTGKTDHDPFRKQRLCFSQFKWILWGNLVLFLQMQQRRVFKPNLLLLSWWKIEVISREKGPVSQKKELVLQQKFSL